jgi:fatty acid desaturase
VAKLITHKNKQTVRPYSPKIDGTKAYIELRSQVIKAGILDRSYWFYSFALLATFAVYGASLYAIFQAKSILQFALYTAIFTFFSVQLAGFLHDAGHRAVFATTKANDLLGTLLGFLSGLAYTPWKIKHNMHHAHPNEEEEDPDVNLPLLSFTTERYKAKKGLAKILRKYQAYLYYPIGIFVVFSLRLTNLYYFKTKWKKDMFWQAIVYVLSMICWYILPFFVFSTGNALLFLLITNFLGGFYILNIFAPNHKGMPYIEKGVKISFLEQQVMTSRNIYGHPVTDYVYMGLNYQIEHHLFPNCPRNKLHKITPYLLAICKKMKLDYTAVGIIETNKIIINELAEVAKTN